MADEPRFKASVMSSTLEFIRKELGDPALQKILGSFDSREIVAKRLPTDWVPERLHRDLLVATHRYLDATPAAGKSPRDFFFQMGRFLAMDGINKYYKSMVSVFDTKFMLTKTPLLWGIIHSHGSLKAEAVSKTSACVYIRDYPTPSREWCLMMTGYMHAVAEMTRAKDVRIQEQECVMDGAAQCKFFGEWK